MASHSAYNASLSPSPLKGFGVKNRKFRPFQLQVSSIGNSARASDNTLVSESARLLGPTASFEASKLKVILMGEGLKNDSAIIPRTYILSHCDFTANLTLTISNVINLDQLKGWYSKDDVVGEWKKVKETMFLNVHCYVSGPNLFLGLIAEFRYHIFSKELPLVLKAVLHGDSVLFTEHPELMDALVCVYFHSSLPKYNRMECWGPMKDAAEVKTSFIILAYIQKPRIHLSKNLPMPVFNWANWEIKIRKVTLHQQSGEEVQNQSYRLCLPSFFDLCAEAGFFLMAAAQAEDKWNTTI